MAADLTQPYMVDPQGNKIFSPAAFPAGATPTPTGPITPVHEVPPSGGFSFRISAITANRSFQILANNASYNCRKIILYAPGAASDFPNLLSAYFAIIPSGAGSIQPVGQNTTELPPGASATIEIKNVNMLTIVLQNLTDVVTGFVEDN